MVLCGYVLTTSRSPDRGYSGIIRQFLEGLFCEVRLNGVIRSSALTVVLVPWGRPLWRETWGEGEQGCTYCKSNTPSGTSKPGRSLSNDSPTKGATRACAVTRSS